MNRKRILIADDEQVIRMIMSIALEEKYEIDEAADGEEAWKKILGADPAYDVLLLDVNMPLLGGTELLQRLMARDPETRVILLTGDPSYLVDSHPCVEVVYKPFSNQALLEAVDKLAGKGQAG